MDGAELHWGVEWVDREELLVGITERLQAEEILSLDTETAGWETGNERLCLVQIGAPKLQMVFLFDALAINKWSPLDELLQAPRPQLIAHNAKFEEKQFARYGIKLRGVVDTLTQARALRPDLPNHTLQTVCRHVLELQLDKTEQTGDWARRPLTDSQLVYARLDAEIAYRVYCAFADMERQLTVDASVGVPLLMEDLAATVGERLKLMKPIATKFALLNAREQMLREAVRSRLVDGEPAYDGTYGKASVAKIKRTVINPLKVRELMPGLAQFAIEESVERQRLIALMKEHGVAEELLDSVTDVTGYVDRLSLAVHEK